MKQASINNLTTLSQLLNSLNESQYCDKTVPPFGSSLGQHTRHTLDLYDRAIEGLKTGIADLTKRDRGNPCESCLETAKRRCTALLDQLESLQGDYDSNVLTTDDVGDGITQFVQTASGLFAYANAHLIHHFATMNFLLHALKVQVNISGFGYNPTTPVTA